jgi:hypothetical protein
VRGDRLAVFRDALDRAVGVVARFDVNAAVAGRGTLDLPNLGLPWPRLDQLGSPIFQPAFMASLFTRMTPMKGSWRNAVDGM